MLSKEFNSVVIHFAETDAEWSASVLAKNNSQCVLCNDPHITPAHMISRRYHATRLVIENGQPLCVKDHNWFDSLSVKKRIEVAILLIGIDVYNLLSGMSRDIVKVKRWE